MDLSVDVVIANEGFVCAMYAKGKNVVLLLIKPSTGSTVKIDKKKHPKNLPLTSNSLEHHTVWKLEKKIQK